jgi:hypothetical protein
LSFELSNQLSKHHDVPSFLSFMKFWTFQGLWNLNEIQASCLFTLMMFVSWFLGTTYFTCFFSWFHDPQASCLFTLVMFISWFLGIMYIIFMFFFLLVSWSSWFSSFLCCL